MTPEPCPTCKGWCCANHNEKFGPSIHYQHNGTKLHFCPDCEEGLAWTAYTEPAPVPPNEEHEELSEARLAALLDAERENTALRQQVAELTALGVSLHKAAAAGRDNERAAVVAWLRASVSPGFADDLYDGVRWRADEIENGEHRRGEQE